VKLKTCLVPLVALAALANYFADAGKAELLSITCRGYISDQIDNGIWLPTGGGNGHAGIVAGFLTSRSGRGVVTATEQDRRTQIDARLETSRAIKPGETVELDAFFIGCFDDFQQGKKAWADALAKKQATDRSRSAAK